MFFNTSNEKDNISDDNREILYYDWRDDVDACLCEDLRITWSDTIMENMSGLTKPFGI